MTFNFQFILILGIDPGTATTGWGLIKHHPKSKKNGLVYMNHGAILTGKDQLMPQRLRALKVELAKLLKIHRPDCVVVEQLFFGVNSKTAMTVGQARGVVMVTVAEEGIPFFEYQGLAVKLALSGYGRSDKKEMQKVVAQKLSLNFVPKPDDAADALAIAICHTIKSQRAKIG